MSTRTMKELKKEEMRVQLFIPIHILLCVMSELSTPVRWNVAWYEKGEHQKRGMNYESVQSCEKNTLVEKLLKNQTSVLLMSIMLLFAQHGEFTRKCFPHFFTCFT